MAIRVFIDQGHNPTGSVNTGASWYGLYEQDITYAIGVALAALLEQDGRFEVRLSRPTPQTVLGNSNTTSLQSRVAQANTWPADYFISIHVNANPSPAANGTEVYIYRDGGQAQWLAEWVLEGITRRMGTKDNGVIVRPGLYVLRNTAMPAILVETAYLSNPDNAALLESDPEGFAQGIYQGMLGYFGF